MVAPIPAGHRSLTPNVVVDGGARALDFYARAFGAEVLVSFEALGKVMHAEVRIGDSIFSLSDELLEFGTQAPAPDAPASMSLTIYCEDADALHARAVDAGATPVTPVADQFHGDHMGTLRDPFGHRWIVATHIEDVAPDEVQRRLDEWVAQPRPT
jgi:PhnB protein